MDAGFWQCKGWEPRWDCRLGADLIVIPAKAGIQRL